ncbi:MAG: hypothetical protein J6333_01390, partial [Planctomycetes bacterium]|nr:hypothetical protein [Planctomycetota bacterium]
MNNELEDRPGGPRHSAKISPRRGSRFWPALALSVAALLMPPAFAAEAPAPGPLCFTAESDGAAVGMEAVGPDAPKVALEVSRDGQTWEAWQEPRTAKLAGKGDKLYVRAAAPNAAFGKGSVFAPHQHSYNHFTVTGKVAASGNVMSLLDRDGAAMVALADGNAPQRDSAFMKLFSGCAGLTAAPELPATKLTSDCYAGMFEGCAGLTAAPKLPATELADACYGLMFADCTGLLAAPQLPATVLAHSCYSKMFHRCAGLATAPDLPATDLAKGCYLGMFLGCRGLTAAPCLPATKLQNHCYFMMFKDCFSLATAPELPSTELEDGCYA